MFLSYLDFILMDQDDGGAGGTPAEEAPAAEEGSEFEIVEETPAEETPAAESQPAQGEQVGTAPSQPTVDYEARLKQQENYYKQQMGGVVKQLNDQKKKLQEYELQGLSQEERERKLLEQQQQQLTQREQQLQQTQYANQLYNYYRQFVPEETFRQAANPAQAQHNVLTHLHKENQSLKQQIDALKKSIKMRPAEPVGGGGQRPRNPNTVNIDDLTPEQVQQRLERLKGGYESFQDVFSG